MLSRSHHRQHPGRYIATIDPPHVLAHTMRPPISKFRLPVFLCCALALAAGTAPAAADPLKLHVPSPDWRDQVIYFLLTDRFDDGDPRNNDQGHGEFRAGSAAHYNGGDLAGIGRRLDYIKGLGATAIWLTPPVANQWWDPSVSYSGYHGYWAENFVKVDRHLGTLDDYRELSHRIHDAGMYLVQDIVLNHVGNFMSYRGGWDPDDPTRFYTPHPDSRPVTAPSQWPFSLNDPRREEDRRAAIYHWTPDISDFSDPRQMLDFQMSGLDDLNTENPLVRRVLRQSYGHWIREVGVDAFRVDTAFYVPAELFDDFLHARDPGAPGIEIVARQTGRRHFLSFGEGFGIDQAFEDRQTQRIESYARDAQGRRLLPGMLNFPLYGSLGDAFARGRPTAELGDRIERMMKRHRDPHLMPSFVDNHDVDRFLAGGSEAGLRQALLALMTLPGIPVIYYGTEQGFTEQRASMFAAGFGSGGRDRFDDAAPLYRYLQRLTALRREHRLFSRGTPKVLRVNPAAPGVLAWRMDHAGRSAIVVMNTAEHETLLDKLGTGLAPGTRLRGLFGIEATPADVTVGPGGHLTLKLPPRSGGVWALAPGPVAQSAAAAATLTLAALPDTPMSADFEVTGHARGLSRLALVVDGDLGSAQWVTPDTTGRWRATIDTRRMADPSTPHEVVAWAESPAAISATRRFTVARPWRVLAELDDPVADDAGPTGRYRYPTAPGWNHPADIRHVRASESGGNLRIEVEMGELSTAWNPANGFDHVAFTIFIGLPDRTDGATSMPLQNASLPAGMKWHLRLRAHGWSNALFSADGASATNEGTPITPGAQIRVDRDRRRLSFELPSAALGNPRSLSGTTLYLTTWDYDGGYRPLLPLPQPHAFGGGDGTRDPLVMDDTAVITLP